ncbi:hypothetical protein OS493_039837, partial [Desmophyllum pertusum]
MAAVSLVGMPLVLTDWMDADWACDRAGPPDGTDGYKREKKPGRRTECGKINLVGPGDRGKNGFRGEIQAGTRRNWNVGGAWGGGCVGGFSGEPGEMGLDGEPARSGFNGPD